MAEASQKLLRSFMCTSFLRLPLFRSLLTPPLIPLSQTPRTCTAPPHPPPPGLAHEVELTAPRLPQLLELKRNGSLGNHSHSQLHAWLTLTWDLEEADESFYCAEGQEAVAHVRWLMIHSDQYAVPAYFAMPGFAAELDRLFPDRMVFRQLAPYLLHPNNLVWERITRFHSVYHSASDKKVGIQVRSRLQSPPPHSPLLNAQHLNSSMYRKRCMERCV